MSNLPMTNRPWLDIPGEKEEPLLDIAAGVGIAILLFCGLWVGCLALFVISEAMKAGPLL